MFLLWLPMLLLSAVLWVMGIAVCSWMAFGRNWTDAVSNKGGRPIKVWNSKWAWLWSNDEDGVLGSVEWEEKYKARPRWGAFVWTALRNPSNNLRYVPKLNVKIDPTKITYVGNHDDPPRKPDVKPPVGDVKWAYTKHGYYSGFVYRRQLTKERHFQIRLGWKLIPKDRFGVDDNDHRKTSCGFGTQLHLFRNKG